MAEVLSNSGIVTGQPVLAAQVSQSVQAFTGAVGYDITISGSLNLPANTQMNGTASNALFATSAGSTTGPVAQVTVSEETAAETNYIVFSPSSSAGGSAQNLKNTDTVGAGGATGGLEYNANTGNLKGKSFQSSVSAATTIGFVGTSSFSNLALASQASTLTNEASDTSCFIPFYTAATGDLPTKTNGGLLFNSSTQLLTVTSASVGDLISTGRVDMVSASFDDLVVSGAGRVGANFTVGGISTLIGAAILSSTASISGPIVSSKVGTQLNASLRFPVVANPDTYTAIHFDGTTDDARIEYGHEGADIFFTRVRMSDNFSLDHFDIMFTGSGAGMNSTPFSAYGNKVLLAPPSNTSFVSSNVKVGIGVSSSGSVQSLLTLEGTSSAASRVVRVMDKGQNHIVMSVDYDANTDGIVRILSGSNVNDGIQLASNDVSFFSKNVGLGDSTPEARLSVRSSASAASRIFEVQNNTGNLLAMVENNATQTGGIFKLNNSAGNQKVKLNSEDNVDMFIGVGTGTPNLGIGTASPSADIHLKKTGSVQMILESDETDGTSYMRFLNDAIAWRVGIQSNDKFALYDGTNAITHLVAENNTLRPCIGIGTTNPTGSVVLDIAGPMRLSGSMIQRHENHNTNNLTINGDGLITSTTGLTANVSSSLILLSDTQDTETNQGTVEVTNWFLNSQVGQVLEVALIADTGPTAGIQLQYYNSGTPVTFNGSSRGTSFTYSSSIFDCPNRNRGCEVKIMKTGNNAMKVFGSALLP